jgi:hypothetical protein
MLMSAGSIGDCPIEETLTIRAGALATMRSRSRWVRRNPLR